MEFKRKFKSGGLDSDRRIDSKPRSFLERRKVQRRKNVIYVEFKHKEK